MEECAILISSEQSKTRHEISGSYFLIGRKSNAQLCLSDANISREHAVIEEKEGVYTVRDLGSTNGTLLNGQKLGLEPVELQDNDLLTFNNQHSYRFISPGKTVPSFDPLAQYGLELIPESLDIKVDGILMHPDKRGYQMISLLAEEPGKIFSYSEIAARLYPDEPHEDGFFQRQRIQAAKNDLSRLLKANGVSRKLIKSRNGIGYHLSGE